jgi:RNA ligase
MFPIIRNISDVLPLIEGRKEFLVMDKGDYIVIDYAYVDNDSFDDPIRLECRGLIFDKATGNILRRPLEKFFNYGEKGTYETLDWSEDHIVMDKRDGSMIAPFILNGQVVLGTRAGVTEHSKKAEVLIDHRTRNEIKLCIQWGFTPIFEWTAPENRIVLSYEKSELRLLAMRYMITGEYIPVEDLKNWSMIFDIPLVDFIQTKLDKDSVFSYRETATETEGYVVFFPKSRLHIKIKTDEYSKMHRAVSFLERETMILPIVLDNLHDDILPALSEDNQKKLIDYAKRVNSEVNILVDSLYSFIGTAANFETRKESAIWIQNNVDKRLWSVVFHGLDEKDVVKSLKSVILKNPELLTVRWN